MNEYMAFYKGRELAVLAPTSYAAQKLAAAQFKAKKAYEVVVILCAIDGAQIAHSGAILAGA
jgi:hypothetical protein